MYIQSRAESDDVNGMMAMVMIAMMIVLVMVNIVPEALNQVDSVRQHLCKTFQQLINFHQPKYKLTIACTVCTGIHAQLIASIPWTSTQCAVYRHLHSIQ